MAPKGRSYVQLDDKGFLPEAAPSATDSSPSLSVLVPRQVRTAEVDDVMLRDELSERDT